MKSKKPTAAQLDELETLHRLASDFAPYTEPPRKPITFSKEIMADTGREIENAFARVGIPVSTHWSKLPVRADKHADKYEETTFYCHINEIGRRDGHMHISSIVCHISRSGTPAWSSTLSLDTGSLKEVFNNACNAIDRTFDDINGAEKAFRTFRGTTQKLEHDLLAFGKQQAKIFAAFRDVEKIMRKMMKSAFREKPSMVNGKRMRVSCRA